MGRLLLLFALTPWLAHAYPTPVDFDGKLLRWNIHPESEPITIRIETDSQSQLEVYEPVIRVAAALWSDLETSYFQYRVLPVEDTTTPSQVTIKLTADFDGGSFSSGYAIFDEVDENNGPVHCTIEIALANSGVTDISRTALHELGHCLGLGHSLIPEAVMSYRTDRNGFQLDTDDIAAVSRLYPANGSKPKQPPGCAVGTQPLNASANALILLTILLLPVLVSLAQSIWSRFYTIFIKS